MSIEEGLLLMGFPVDLFEGLGLSKEAQWRLLGNSVNVFDLTMFQRCGRSRLDARRGRARRFYESLLPIHHARHGVDVQAERDAAIQRFRRAKGFGPVTRFE